MPRSRLTGRCRPHATGVCHRAGLTTLSGVALCVLTAVSSAFVAEIAEVRPRERRNDTSGGTMEPIAELKPLALTTEVAR